MSQYAYPYLSPVQTRTHEVTALQQELANAIERNDWDKHTTRT